MAYSTSSLSLLHSYQIIHSLHCHRTLKKIKPSFIFSRVEKHSSLICFSSKKKLSFMDQILDYIEGGPKLRKWYGAPDILAKDGNPLEEDESREGDEVRDAVLVTDGDNEIGQMIILSLIVKRVRVKALVKDKRAAMEAFGTYVESIAGDAKNNTFLKKALRGVRAVICPNEGFLSNVDSWKGLQHVILLSQLSVYRDTSGIQAMMNSNARKLSEQDESMVKASGIPYTIIRTGVLKNNRGGKQGFSFEEGSATQGSLSKEDAAFICVEALDAVPQKGLVFEVVNGDDKVSDWKSFFQTLLDNSSQQ
ncbi:NAD(P)-binding Rossmann-fold superfamily protein [Forsythia ovata]|uniref:NAD(P)-binding Rossmann-fold superfamily protein n=1 Tax=Forsythia ovata TaxID=205694 RepID=A0ABD1PXC2_9LAMI